MERANFVNKFSKRLCTVLEKEGHVSSRSKAGIEISQLAKVAGVSYQMARKYALGMALPDYHVIPKIANWLNVSPSWLLFGEKETRIPELKPNSLIEIDTELLRHILNKCSVLFPHTIATEKIINFIVGVIYDASHINADANTIFKIIDMMLSSAIQMSELGLNKRA